MIKQYYLQNKTIFKFIKFNHIIIFSLKINVPTYAIDLSFYFGLHYE